MEYDISVSHMQPRHNAVVRQTIRVPEMGEKLGHAFGAVMAYLGARGVQPIGMPFASYQMKGEGVFDVASGFPVALAIDGEGEVVPFDIPECDVVSTIHMGAYDEVSKAYEAISDWIRANGRERLTPDVTWEEYFSPPGTPPAETRTGVHWALKPD